MSKEARDAILRRQATVAYVDAYKCGPVWNKIYSEDAIKMLQYEAAVRNSTDTNVISSFIMAISTVIGRHGKVDMPGGKDTFLNMFLILIGRPGCGKSPALNDFLLAPLKRLEVEKKFRVIIQDCTPAGLISFLRENNGGATYASDECCQRLTTLLANRRQESSSMRSTFNTFYSGYGIQKVFATKPDVNVSDVFFGVFGTTQPHPYAEFLKEVDSVDDGLSDRFFPVVSRPFKAKVTGEIFGTPNDWIYDALKRIFEIHFMAPNGFRRYVFDDEAKEIFIELQREAEEAIEESYRELEERGDDPTLLVEELPTASNESKTYDYAAKLATLIHITSSIFDSVAIEKNLRFDVSTVISKNAVEKALQLIAVFNLQREKFKSLLTVDIPYAMQRQAQQNFDNREESLHKIILLFPGKAISTAMVSRKHRHLRRRCLELREAMKSFGSKRGDANYAGKFKRVGRNMSVFYKAAWEHTDHNLMERLGISHHDYVSAYSTNMRDPPAAGIAANWETYYQGLMDSTPDMDTE